jgi:hypothetical protein
MGRLVCAAMLSLGTLAACSGTVDAHASSPTHLSGVPPPVNGVPAHVRNWLYACAGPQQTCSQALNVGISATWMAAHADWNEVYYDSADDATSARLASAGAHHIVAYLDPNISPYCPVPAGYDASSTDFPENGADCTGTIASYLRAENGSYAHAFQHQSNGDRLVDHADGFYNGEAQEPFYIGDPDVQAAFETASVQNAYATDVFEDDGGGAYNCVVGDDGECTGTYGPASSAPPLCTYTGGYWCYKYGETAHEWDAQNNSQTAYAQDAIALSSAAQHPVIGNDGIADDSYDLQWVQSQNVEGVMWEGAWKATLGTDAWVAKADAVLAYHALHKYVVEFSSDESDLFFEIASHWIVYDPTYSIEGLAAVNPAAHAAGTNDTTYPEEEVVPSAPLVASPQGGDVTSFETAPGLFVREYATCYEDASPIGPCAAVVNTTGASMEIVGLTQQYGDVLEHDTDATWAAGGAPLWQAGVPTEIGPAQGLVLAR